MVLFVGLPLEQSIDVKEEIDRLKEEFKMNVVSIKIPNFTNLCISSCSSYDDILCKSEKDCMDLVKAFNKPLPTLKYEWDTEKYGSTDIEECLKMVLDDLGHIRNLYFIKKDEHTKYKKETEKLRKRTHGNLIEKDINVSPSNYEFLEDVFIVVDKESTTFIPYINNSDMASEETLEKISEDEKYALYKVLILKIHVKAFKKDCAVNGFHIKEINNESALPQIEKDELELFIDTHFLELYKILIHLKLIKLFIESFCRYGLPKEYIFLACTGDKLFQKFKKISENWKSDRVMEDSDDEEVEETNYAHTLLELDRVE